MRHIHNAVSLLFYRQKRRRRIPSPASKVHGIRFYFLKNWQKVLARISVGESRILVANLRRLASFIFSPVLPNKNHC